MQNFRFKEIINVITQRAIEHGFTKYFQSKTDLFLGLSRAAKGINLNQSGNNFTTLKFKDLHFIFVIYACAIIIATISFVIECLWNKTKKVVKKNILFCSYLI